MSFVTMIANQCIDANLVITGKHKKYTHLDVTYNVESHLPEFP